jgi:hypothetical protein
MLWAFVAGPEKAWQFVQDDDTSLSFTNQANQLPFSVSCAAWHDTQPVLRVNSLCARDKGPGSIAAVLAPDDE